jgi:hypothetical protein
LKTELKSKLAEVLRLSVEYSSVDPSVHSTALNISLQRAYMKFTGM